MSEFNLEEKVNINIGGSLSRYLLSRFTLNYIERLVGSTNMSYDASISSG